MERKEPAEFCLKGKVIAIVYDEFGNIKQRVENPNTVVTIGKGAIGQKVCNPGSSITTAARFIHIGTGVGAPAITDTSLFGWVAFVSADYVQPGGVNDVSWQLVATFGASVPNANVTLTESAVQFTSGNSQCFSRQTFGVTKNTPDILTIIWQYSVN